MIIVFTYFLRISIVQQVHISSVKELQKRSDTTGDLLCLVHTGEPDSLEVVKSGFSLEEKLGIPIVVMNLDSGASSSTDKDLLRLCSNQHLKPPITISDSMEAPWALSRVLYYLKNPYVNHRQ